jgi:hypothetical protein
MNKFIKFKKNLIKFLKILLIKNFQSNLSNSYIDQYYSYINSSEC